MALGRCHGQGLADGDWGRAFRSCLLSCDSDRRGRAGRFCDGRSRACHSAGGAEFPSFPRRIVTTRHSTVDRKTPANNGLTVNSTRIREATPHAPRKRKVIRKVTGLSGADKRYILPILTASF